MEFLLGVLTNISLPCFGCFNIDLYTAFDLLNCLLLSFTISNGCMVVLLKADHWVYGTTLLLLVHSVLAIYCLCKGFRIHIYTRVTSTSAYGKRVVYNREAKLVTLLPH